MDTWNQGGERRELVVRLTVSSGDPINGTVALGDGTAPCPFHGWIQLMAVVDELRLGGRPAADQS